MCVKESDRASVCSIMWLMRVSDSIAWLCKVDTARAWMHIIMTNLMLLMFCSLSLSLWRYVTHVKRDKGYLSPCRCLNSRCMGIGCQRRPNQHIPQIFRPTELQFTRTYRYYTKWDSSFNVQNAIQNQIYFRHVHRRESSGFWGTISDATSLRLSQWVRASWKKKTSETAETLHTSAITVHPKRRDRLWKKCKNWLFCPWF